MMWARRSAWELQKGWVIDRILGKTGKGSYLDEASGSNPDASINIIKEKNKEIIWKNAYSAI